MNYIEEYYGQILDGRVAVSEKVRRVYKHLVDKLHDTGSQYVYDDEKAKYVIEFVETFCCQSKGAWWQATETGTVAEVGHSCPLRLRR